MLSLKVIVLYALFCWFTYLQFGVVGVFAFYMAALACLVLRGTPDLPLDERDDDRGHKEKP